MARQGPSLDLMGLGAKVGAFDVVPSRGLLGEVEMWAVFWSLSTLAWGADLSSERVVHLWVDGAEVLAHHGEGFCHFAGLQGITIDAPERAAEAFEVRGDASVDPSALAKGFTGLLWEDRGATGGPLSGAAPLALGVPPGSPAQGWDQARAEVLDACAPDRLTRDQLALLFASSKGAPRNLLVRWLVDAGLRRSACVRSAREEVLSAASACAGSGKCSALLQAVLPRMEATACD